MGGAIGLRLLYAFLAWTELHLLPGACTDVERSAKQFRLAACPESVLQKKLYRIVFI
jgi:hypothetical protein